MAIIFVINNTFQFRFIMNGSHILFYQSIFNPVEATKTLNKFHRFIWHAVNKPGNLSDRNWEISPCLLYGLYCYMCVTGVTRRARKI